MKKKLKKDEVTELRRAVFKRCKGQCEYCGELITWGTMQMHEEVFRSKGGKQSMDNCVALCHGCHQGRKDAAHTRHLRFGETNGPIRSSS